VRTAVVVALAAGAAVLAGCGGGTRQDAGEAKQTYQMAVAGAFAPRQAVARPTRMALRVRNTGTATVPNVAVTVDSFSYTSNFPELAANKRPIWVIERGPGDIPTRPVESQEVSPPGNGQTAYVNTWALGPLAVGQTRTFVWALTPVKPGIHRVNFAVSAGLAGNAKAELSSGAAVRGHFVVAIAGEPPTTHVDPNTGQVVLGTYPPTP